MGIIYKAINKINGKTYIGKTIQTLKQRKAGHKAYSKRLNYNDYFHSAIRENGWDNFEWKIIYESLSNERLAEMETVKIIFEHSHYTEGGYNLTWGGEGVQYYNEKIIQKMKDNHKGMSGKKHSKETKEIMSKKAKGRVFSEGHKNNLSKSHLGKTLSSEHKLKIGIANKGKRKDKMRKYSDTDREKAIKMRNKERAYS